jgi:hypothetical protein
LCPSTAAAACRAVAGHAFGVGANGTAGAARATDLGEAARFVRLGKAFGAAALRRRIQPISAASGGLARQAGGTLLATSARSAARKLPVNFEIKYLGIAADMAAISH